jgi:hypothetical protein
MTTGVCQPVGGNHSEPGKAYYYYKLCGFHLTFFMIVTVALAAVERPSCPVAANNCVSRFGSAYQGQGYVSKCGAPCASVRTFTLELGLDLATHKI